MKLFENGVGRPSNETLKKRRNFYIFVFLLAVLVIGGGYLYLKNIFSDSNIESKNKNIQSSINGDVASDIVSTVWDGKITSSDATYILKYSVNLGNPSASQKKRADINGDGYVNTSDSRLVSQLAIDGLAYGDINKDKKHDKKDIDICNEFISGKRTPTDEQKKILDFNGNGKIDVNDRKVLEKVIAGYGDVVTDENYTKGDGKLTITDAKVVLKIAAGNLKPSDLQRKMADYDKDGKITAKDARKILEYLDEDDNIFRETVTVYFDKNSAKSVEKSSATCKISTLVGKESCEIKVPTVTLPSGYTFVGWSTSKNGKTAQVVPNGTFKASSNTTLYAIIRSTNPYKLTFNKSEAASIGATSASCYLYNSEKTCSVKMPTITAQTGYIALGWSKDINGRKSQIISAGKTINISENALYYAIANNLKNKIPDESLRKCVLKTYNFSVYYKKVDLSNEELKTIKRIEGCDGSITDATGIQYLTNLEGLIINSKNLNKIDVSKNTKLTYLDVSQSSLTELDVSKNTKLVTLKVEHNKLKKLNLIKNTELNSIFATSNNLTTIDVSKNAKLTYLAVNNNALTSIKVSGANLLSYLAVSFNKITNIDLSNNTRLSTLYVDQNKITSIDLSKNAKLVNAVINDNLITSLDVSKNTSLEMLVAKRNKLTSLNVSGAKALSMLDAGSNKLTSIDVSKNLQLTYLNVSYNSLTKLDVSKNTKLTKLYYNGNNISKENLILGNNKNIK